jgi:hypothetical protein
LAASVRLGLKIAIIDEYWDRYLARTGYQAQQMNEPADATRPHNLWEPVPGDHGAHGVFNACAHGWSAQLWATTHRGWLTLAGLGLAGFAYVWGKKRMIEYRGNR